MNRGEGLKIAARAKHGTVGLFQEDKKTKKRFSYKSRTQAFPVRRPQTNVDSKDMGKHPGTKSESKRTLTQGKYQKPDKSSATNRSSRDNAERKMRSTNSGKKELSGGRKRQTVDFIKKNKSVGGTKSAGSGGTSSGVGGADTIALTQEQLNVILQSIGAASGGTPVISIENGQVKIMKKEEEINGVGMKESNDGENQDEEEEKEQRYEESRGNRNEDERLDATSGNVLQLLKELEVDSNKAEMETTHEAPYGMANTEYSTSGRDSHSDNLRKKGNSGQKKEEFIWGNPVGMGNIGAVMDSQRVLSAQEKKKLEWKKALDEQIAEKKRHKEQETVLHKSLDKRETEIFEHKPPQQNEMIYTSRNNKMKNPVEYSTVRESSLGHHTKQSDVPSAMRSNFFIGGSAGERADDQNKELKRKEQQEWMQALERQRQEAVEIKDRERRKQQEEDSKIGHWTDKPSPRKTTENMIQSQTFQPSSRVTSVAFTPVDTADILSPRQSGEMTFARGGLNSLVDPAEQERRGMANKKHTEHMQAIQQQVEEKQRVKQEAEERRRKDEANEERRLAAERENIQRQFDLEKEKQRQKEEAAAAKHRALEEGILNAQQDALAAKHAKRVQRLNQQGHDTSHLRKSWDAQHTEASPRQVVHSSQQHQPIQHSPPPPPPPLLNGNTHTLTPDSGGVSTSSGGMKDATTSTISDQSTQTGFAFESVSPAILEVIRQASAGIEYKQSGRDEREHDRGHKSERGKKTDRAKLDNTPRGRNKKDVKPEEKTKPPKQKKNTEKPKWGQNLGKKKVSNSDKDLSKVGKGREERRRRRQEELLAQQERLTRRRDSLKQRPPSGVDSRVGYEAPASDRGPKTDREPFSQGHSKSGRETHGQHLGNEKDSLSKGHPRGHSRTEDTMTGRETGHRGGGVRQESGAIEGDFYPFLRSEDIKLTNRTVTPDWEGHIEEQEMYIDTNSYTPHPRQTQMDPLLNPERLKDSGQRQEKILEQLSHLRQGLMMKQREIELGLSPTMM